MKTYEIPTAQGVKTVQATSKQDAFSRLSKNFGLTPINPNVPSVVNSGNLQQTPKLVLPKAPTPTYGDVGSAIDATVADTRAKIKSDQNQAVLDAQKVKDSNKESIFDLTQMLGDSGIMTEQAYKDQGVDVAKQQYDDYTNQIEAEDNALRRKLETLDKNPQGLFGGALQDEKNRVERESLSKRADLAILQNASIRKYDTARDIADRTVQLKLEPIKAKLDAYKFIYEENKDNFTTLEKRQYEEQIKEDDRAYAKQEADLKEISDLSLDALQNGAPASVATQMRSAKTVEEAMKIGGRYIGAFERQLKSLQIQKLKSELLPNSDAGDLVKINGKDYIRYKDGTISEPVLPEASDTAVVVSRLDNKLSTLDKLLNPSVGLATSAGTLRGAPVPFLLKGKINDWRADAINVVQKLTVDELGRVKSDGVTFGALSNGERQAVGDAATALGAASLRDKEGNPTGKFKMSEKKVIQEFQKIYDGYALDFERRTGIKYSDYKNNPDIVKQKNS